MTDEEMEEIQSRVGDYDMFVDDVACLLEYVEELRNLLNEKE